MSLELLEEITRLEKQRDLLLKAVGLRNEIANLTASMTIGPDAFHKTCTTIASTVCQHYRVSLGEIIGKRRPARIVEPRHLIFYLVCEFTNAPMHAVAKAFSRRDHGTVIWAVNQMENRMSDPRFALTVATLKEQCAEALKKGTNETQT